MTVLGFKLKAALLGAACALQATSGYADIIINQILPAGVPTPGLWYEGSIAAGGTIGTVDLTGMGGNLETAQPLPTGAARITTANDNASRAEAFTYDDLGGAASFLSNVTMGYSYYKTTNAISPSAAPSLKLTVAATGGTGDNFGNLIYEPYWNQPVGNPLVAPADAWQTVSIDMNAGSGDVNHGGWWWSGGFEIPSGSGGPPIRSLAEWVTAFQASDATDFATARIVGIGVGEGTFNPAELSYFDNVSYKVIGGGSQRWNFQAIPEPASMGLAGIAAVAGLAVRRRTRKS